MPRHRKAHPKHNMYEREYRYMFFLNRFGSFLETFRALLCTQRRKADFSLHGRTSEWPCAPGGGSSKKEACSGANVPWCYFAVSEKLFRHWPGKTWFKVNGAYDAILRAQAWSVRTAGEARVFFLRNYVLFWFIVWLAVLHFFHVND